MSDSPWPSKYLASSGGAFFRGLKPGVPTGKSKFAGWQPHDLVGFGQKLNGESL